MILQRKSHWISQQVTHAAPFPSLIQCHWHEVTCMQTNTQIHYSIFSFWVTGCLKPECKALTISVQFQRFYFAQKCFRYYLLTKNTICIKYRWFVHKRERVSEKVNGSRSPIFLISLNVYTLSSIELPNTLDLSIFFTALALKNSKCSNHISHMDRDRYYVTQYYSKILT